MAESYSIEAILSVKDKMSSAFGKAEKNASSFGGKLKSALGTGVAMGAGMKALSAVTNTLSSSLDGAISRYDTLNNYKKVMSNLGVGAKNAGKAMKIFDKGIEGLPTTLDQAASGVQRLTSKNGDVIKSSKYFVAMNDAIVAGGASADIQASAVEQLSQAYSKGKMDMMEWRTLQMAMPGQLNQIAKAMGVTQDELGEGLRKGDISMEKFMETMQKLDKEGVGEFKNFHVQARNAIGGIGTQMSLLKTSVTRGMANAMKSIDKALKKNGLPKMSQMIGNARDKIDSAFKSVNSFIEGLDLSGVASVASDAFSTLGKAAQTAGKLVGKAITFITDHAEQLAVVAKALIVVAAAFKVISIAKTIASGVQAMAGAFGLLTPAAATAAPATATAGTAAKTAAKGFVEAGVGLLAMGAGFALIAVGFALLTQSAIALAGAGAPAVGILAGMVVAIGGLIGLVSALGAGLAVAAPGLIAFGAAAVLVGAGIAIACLGIQKLDGVIQAAGQAIVSVVNALGTNIAIVLAGLSGTFASFASSIGSVLSSVGNLLVTFGNTVNSVLTTVGNLFTNFATAVSTVMTSVSDIITSIGDAISGILERVAGIFEAIGTAAINAGTGMERVANGISRLVALPLGDLSATLGATARGLKKIASSGDGMSQVAAALTTVAASIRKVSSGGSRAAAALNKLQAAMTSLAATASGAGKAVGANFASGISSGMSKAAAMATAAATKIVAAMKRITAQAKSAGKAAGTGFTSAFQSGLNRAPSVASSIMARINAQFASGVARARSTGYNMGAGLASGMESAAGRCEAAAARIVRAAAKAANAAAQVHSPSKLTKKTGRWMGIGLAKGIASQVKTVKKAAVKLVSTVRSVMKKATKRHNFENAAEKAIKKFTNKIEKKTRSTEKKVKKSVDKIFKKALKKVNNKKLQKKLKNVQSTIKNKFTKTLTKEMNSAVSATNKQLTKLAKKYQEKYDAIMEAQDTFISKMKDYGSLYSSDTYGFLLFKDFKSATDQLKTLKSNLQKLQDIGISMDFLNEITKMDTASQIEYTNALLSKGDEFIRQQNSDFLEFMKTAQSVGTNIYKPYVKALDTEYNAELKTVMTKLQKQLKQIGKNAAAGLVDGLKNKKTKKKLQQVSKSLADTIIKQIKSSLKIASPSKVLDKVGNLSGQGLVNGLDDMRRDVAIAAERLVTIPDLAISGGYSGSLSSDYEYYGQAQYTVIVPVDLDGKEVARVTAPYMEDNLNQRQKRRDRARGNI